MIYVFANMNIGWCTRFLMKLLKGENAIISLFSILYTIYVCGLTQPINFL